METSYCQCSVAIPAILYYPIRFSAAPVKGRIIVTSSMGKPARPARLLLLCLCPCLFLSVSLAVCPCATRTPQACKRCPAILPAHLQQNPSAPSPRFFRWTPRQSGPTSRPQWLGGLDSCAMPAQRATQRWMYNPNHHRSPRPLSCQTTNRPAPIAGDNFCLTSFRIIAPRSAFFPCYYRPVFRFLPRIRSDTRHLQ